MGTTKNLEELIDHLAIMTGKGFERTEEQFRHVDEQFQHVEERFKGVDNQFERVIKLIHEGFARMDGELSEIKNHLEHIDVFMVSHERRLSRLETKSD